MSKKTENEGNPSSVTLRVPPSPKGEGSGPVVYCGPSVRNVVRQYTVFAGEIPQALEKFLAEHPAAKALLVPVERFAETRTRLETKGSAEAIVYNKVKSEL